MIIYRIGTFLECDPNESTGFIYSRNKKSLKKYVDPDNHRSVIERHEVPTDKNGLIEWLNTHASHPEN